LIFFTSKLEKCHSSRGTGYFYCPDDLLLS
jgi:hypothetical protein